MNREKLHQNMWPTEIQCELNLKFKLWESYTGWLWKRGSLPFSASRDPSINCSNLEPESKLFRSAWSDLIGINFCKSNCSWISKSKNSSHFHSSILADSFVHYSFPVFTSALNGEKIACWQHFTINSPKNHFFHPSILPYSGYQSRMK